ATVLNDIMTVTAAGGRLGIPGLYVTGDPGGIDENARIGQLGVRIGLGWAKSLSFTTGQCPVMRYHRGLMMAILHDRVQIARIAVIGTGWWSTYTHIPGLKEYPHADLVALCDPDEERLREAAERYGIAKSYRDVDELLRSEKLDGAVVAVNHTAHYSVARKC